MRDLHTVLFGLTLGSFSGWSILVLASRGFVWLTTPTTLRGTFPELNDTPLRKINNFLMLMCVVCWVFVLTFRV
jgi:hypothetical protein